MYEKPDKCPICWESLSDDDHVECGHWVHIACLIKCYKAECPVCRKKLDIKLSEKPDEVSDDDISYISSDVEPYNIPNTYIELDPLPYSKYRDEVSGILNYLIMFREFSSQYAHDFISYDIEFVHNIYKSDEISKHQLNACHEAEKRAYYNNCMSHDLEPDSSDEGSIDYPSSDESDVNRYDIDQLLFTYS